MRTRRSPLDVSIHRFPKPAAPSFPRHSASHNTKAEGPTLSRQAAINLMETEEA